MSSVATTTGRCSVCHVTYEHGERFCSRDGGAVIPLTEGADPLIGQTLDGRYFVRGFIGRGGMGAVYEGEHVGLDRPVAIKVIRRDHDADARARFRREARAASRVVHEHVVQIFDVGTADTSDFLVMELVEGLDLEHVLRDGALAVPRAV